MTLSFTPAPGSTPSAATAPAPLRTMAPPGSGAVRVVRRGERSVVQRAFATSPLRLLTPKNHGQAAWIFTSSFGGGLVDGDRVALDVEIGEGASAYLSTQASTKVYRSAGGTSATLRARVGEHATLVLVPDPVVGFAESRFSQHQEFDVAGSGALVVVDWVTSGRRESGERWAFAHYSSRLVARVDGELAVYDALALRREDGDLATRLGRFDVLAIVVVLGQPLVPYAHTLTSRFEREPVQRTPSQLVVATPLLHPTFGTIGCTVRAAGQSVEGVGRALRSALSFVPSILGDDPWRRKW